MTTIADPPTAGGKTTKTPKRRGHMFLVDVPTFAKVCSLGDADAAASYLILAAGTGADNRTSTWSREAINKRTALNWRKADAAMKKLEDNGLIRWVSGKGTRKPRIDLPPVETRPPMQRNVAALFDIIGQGRQPHSQSEKAAATLGLRDGWLVRGEDGLLEQVMRRMPKVAYLPMELVGDTFGETRASATTIVDRIRMSRDPMALRLLIDLYSLQDLAEHGGVNDYYLWTAYSREKGGASGSLQLWNFARETQTCRLQSGPLAHHWRTPTKEEEQAGKNGAADFFSRVQILCDAGALEWTYYLKEDGEGDAPRIYPVGVSRHGKFIWTELESIIGGYAIRAACALSDEAPDKLENAIWHEANAPKFFILPADRLAREAALVGVPRLRHRARTSNAARWRQELLETVESIVPTFRGIIADHAPALLVEVDKRLADFNVGFNGASTEISKPVQRDINDPYQSSMHDRTSFQDADDHLDFLDEMLDEEAAAPLIASVADRMAAWEADDEEYFRATGAGAGR
jgi:hypothetical protein